MPADPSRAAIGRPPRGAPLSQGGGPTPPRWVGAQVLPAGVFVGGVVAALTILAPRIWPVLLIEGLRATAVVAAAAGWGAWPTLWLGFGGHRATQQFCIAAAVGMGILSVATLCLGVMGLLSPVAGWGLVIAGVIAGLVRLYMLQGGALPGRQWHDAPRSTARQAVLQALVVLAVVIPAAVAFFGACLPPGLLWSGEARGYDVLEYHLQMPREYYDAGRIAFLPHNVYASFPQQMETLYLLLMYLAGGPHAAAIPAQLLHAFCGVLLVIAIASWQPAGWSRIVAVVAAGSVPWLAYLGCLAYVELGMLFLAAVAAGLVADQNLLLGQGASARERGWRTALAAGLCAGLAAGYKYTGTIFVVVALAVAWLVSMSAPVGLRLRRAALFALGAAVAYSPWLIRNAAFTGNPVYPFVYALFDGAAWSAEQSAQWDRGHRLPAEAASLAGRGRTALRELLGDFARPSAGNDSPQWFVPSLFGPALFVLATAGLLAAPTRRTVMLALWSGLIVAAWATLTHMPGRFAVPLIVPLAMLSGASLEVRRAGAKTLGNQPVVSRRLLRLALVAVAAVGAAFNAKNLYAVLDEHDRQWGRLTGSRLATWIGRPDVLVEAEEVNDQTLPADAYVWLVGRANVFYINRRIHYTVVFNRDPWLELAGRGADPATCLAWLRTQGVTHVVFSWSEIKRLRETYGFAEVVTRRWAEELAAAGLHRLQASRTRSGPLISEIFEVAPQ